MGTAVGLSLEPEVLGRRRGATVAHGLLRHRGAVVGGTVVGTFVLLALVGPSLVPYDPLEADFSAVLTGPSRAHWFGTDPLGRDVLSRVVAGARLSLLIVVGAVAGGVVIGGAAALWAAYRGGIAEAIVMRSVDVLLALPGFLVTLIVVAIMGMGAVPVVIGVIINSLPSFARVTHASTLAIRESQFVEGARGLGASGARILGRHLLPGILSPLLVQVSLRMATGLLTVSSLTFLGLGVQPPLPEWGAMLAEGRSYFATHPHLMLFPGLALMLVTLGFNLLGDGIRDALDPRQRS